MLLGILDLEKAKVNDIMIPKNEVVGINLNLSNEQILRQLSRIQHTVLPVYENDMNHTQGVIHTRLITHLLSKKTFSKERLKKALLPAYFVPEGTALHAQLIKFRETQNRFGLVVDEYGMVLGVVTLSDLLEEIVGKFTTDHTKKHEEIYLQQDGTYLVDASIGIRELNRITGWDLPTLEASTLSGMIIAYLETIPTASTCVLINDYPIEIIRVQDNTIKTVRVLEQLDQKN